MRWLAALALSACYAPDLPPCTVTCGPSSPCPADLSCGADHFCHADGDDTTCSATLSVQVNGAGHVTSMPSGIDCTGGGSGDGCGGPFAVGTSITLTQNHGNDVMFAHWGGDACGGSMAQTCTFTIEMPMTVAATFH